MMSIVVEKKRIRKEKRNLMNSMDPELKNEWDKSNRKTNDSKINFNRKANGS